MEDQLTTSRLPVRVLLKSVVAAVEVGSNDSQMGHLTAVARTLVRDRTQEKVPESRPIFALIFGEGRCLELEL